MAEYTITIKDGDDLGIVVNLSGPTNPEGPAARLALGLVTNYDVIKAMHVFNALDEVYEEGMTIRQANEAVKQYLIKNGYWVEPEAEVSKPTENKLLATVGGVTSIVEISRAVSAGEMTETAAENLLVTVFGIKPDEAKKLIELPAEQPEIQSI